MERDADGRLLVVADASFLINFLAIDRMDVLGKLTRLRFHMVNPEVIHEVLNVMLALAREVADRVVFMGRGRDRGNGRAEGLLREPREERTRRFREKIP